MADPLAEGRGATPQVHGNIQNMATEHLDQLALWPWGELVMEPANNLWTRPHEVVLHKGCANVRVEGRRAEGLAEEATGIMVPGGLDQNHFGYGQLREVEGHRAGRLEDCFVGRRS